MKKMFLIGGFAAALCAGVTFASCSNDDNGIVENPNPDNGSDDNNGEGVKAKFVISAMAGTANYIVESDALDEGEVTVLGNGLEAPTGTTWLFYKDLALYRLQYNQGNNGVTTSYELNAQGKAAKRDNEYQISRFTSYGIYGDYILTSASSDTDKTDVAGNVQKGLTFTYLHVADESKATKTIVGENFLGNGEYVTLSGYEEANGKIYTAVIPMGLSVYGSAYENGKWIKEGNEDLVKTEDGGQNSGSYKKGELQGTQYPDECWVAIYNSKDFENPTLVKTDKISYACGRMKSQYYQTIWAADNGDVYVFSPSYAKAQADNRQKTTLNSGVARIKAGATEFDPDYYFDLEAVSGGQPVYRCWHMSGDYFLLQMYTQGLNSQGQGANKLAVYKGESKTFTYVSGLPDADLISEFAKAPYTEDGMTYVGVVTTDGSKPAIYEIDPATAKATKGLTVNADGISAIGKLKY